MAALQKAWRLELGAVRANSAVDRLLRVLPGAPVLTVESASRRLGVSPNRVGPAVNTLVEKGRPPPTKRGRQRYRIFTTPAVLEMWGTVDAELAAPRLGPTRERQGPDA